MAAAIFSPETLIRTATLLWEYCVLLYTHKSCAHAFEQARGGSGAWYAMELTELLPHVASGLKVDWDEATRYAGLAPEVR